MAIVPLVLNIFGDGPRLWLSRYESPNWTTQEKIADSDIDPTIDPAAFSAGAVSGGQVSKLGIVLWLIDRTSIRFYGDGTITPVDITPPTHYTYVWPHLNNTFTGSFTKTIGAFYHDGAYWMFVIRASIFPDITDTTRQWVCLRSADEGATWAEQDTANAPFLYNDGISSSVPGGSCQNVYWDGSSDEFFLFCSVLGSGDPDRTYGQVFTFDTSLNGGLGGWTAITDQFLASGTGGSDGRLYGSNFQTFSGGNMAGYAFPLSNGDLLSIYSTAFGAGSSDGGASNGIYVRVASGGAWGSTTQIRNTPALLALAVFDPDTDTAYVFEYITGKTGQTPAPPTAFGGGVRVFSVDSSGTASATLFTFPDPTGGTIAGPNGYTDGMDRGIIIDGSMWVLYDDWADDSNAVWAWDMSVALDAGPGFVKLNLLPHPSEEPPSGPTEDNPPSCGMLFFGEMEVPPPTQSLRLIKTVDGGDAVPEMWLLTGTGPSQTVSGAGDTGVVAVTDPQTFELEETTGPDGYTAGSWDCGSAIMPTPTSVIVDESGTPVVSPVQIPTDHTYSQFLNGGTPSTFHVGANLYRVLVSTSTLGIFKRAAASVGGAWTEIDSAHAPGGQSRYAKATINSAGTIIAVAYLIPGQVQMKIVTFNTGTDLWGTPTAAVTVESPLSFFGFVQRTDNTFVVVGGGTNHIYYITNTAGTWTGPTGLILNPEIVLDACIDSTNVIHLLEIGVSLGCGYRQLSATYVLSAPLLGPIAATSVTAQGCPSIIIWDSTNVVICGKDNVGAPFGKAQAWIGTPLAGPTFTDYFVATPAAGHTLSYIRVAEGLANDLNMFYADTNLSTPTIELKQSVFDGVSAWGAPTTFYDEIANPPSNNVPTVNQALQGSEGLELAGGWAVASALNTTPGTVSTGEFLEEITPTGEVVCEITNTFGAPPFEAECPSNIYVVGTPYSSFVVVSGGVPPYTFAVTSGSLPTGLSLNASTGEVSGTPSADGPFDFVITVTDDDGNTTTTGSCSAGRCPGSRSLL